MTGNGAYTWTAAVQETVDATLNRTVSSGKRHKPMEAFAQTIAHIGTCTIRACAVSLYEYHCGKC